MLVHTGLPWNTIGSEMGVFSHHIGRALSLLRVSEGWSQQQLAEKWGVSRSSVQQMEGSKSNPTASSIDRLLSTLGLGPQDLADALQISSEVPDDDEFYRQRLPRTRYEWPRQDSEELISLMAELKKHLHEQSRARTAAVVEHPSQPLDVDKEIRELAEHFGLTDRLEELQQEVDRIRPAPAPDDGSGSRRAGQKR